MEKIIVYFCLSAILLPVIGMLAAHNPIKGWKRKWWHYVIGVFFLCAGINSLFVNPEAGIWLLDLCCATYCLFYNKSEGSIGKKIVKFVLVTSLSFCLVVFCQFGTGWTIFSFVCSFILLILIINNKKSSIYKKFKKKINSINNIDRAMPSCQDNLNAKKEGIREETYCRHCGKPIESNSKFCSYCGKKQTIE